jgi:hypothetical protein
MQCQTASAALPPEIEECFLDPQHSNLIVLSSSNVCSIDTAVHTLKGLRSIVAMEWDVAKGVGRSQAKVGAEEAG